MPALSSSSLIELLGAGGGRSSPALADGGGTGCAGGGAVLADAHHLVPLHLLALAVEHRLALHAGGDRGERELGSAWHHGGGDQSQRAAAGARLTVGFDGGGGPLRGSRPCV